MGREFELPIKVSDCRQRLGVSGFYMSALLNRMGLRRVRRVHLSKVSKFLRENPTFNSREVYPRKEKSQRAE